MARAGWKGALPRPAPLPGPAGSGGRVPASLGPRPRPALKRAHGAARVGASPSPYSSYSFFSLRPELLLPPPFCPPPRGRPQVEHIHLFMDFRTKLSKGCGFVTFAARKEAEDAMKVRPGAAQRSTHSVAARRAVWARPAANSCSAMCSLTGLSPTLSATSFTTTITVPDTHI